MVAMKSGISWVVPIESEILGESSYILFFQFSLIKPDPSRGKEAKNNTRKKGFDRYFRKSLFTSESHIPSSDLSQSGHSLMLRTSRESARPLPVLLLLTNTTFYLEPTQRTVSYQKKICLEFLFTLVAPFLASCSCTCKHAHMQNKDALFMEPSVQQQAKNRSLLTPVCLRGSRSTAKTDWE